MPGTANGRLQARGAILVARVSGVTEGGRAFDEETLVKRSGRLQGAMITLKHSPRLQSERQVIHGDAGAERVAGGPMRLRGCKVSRNDDRRGEGDKFGGGGVYGIEERGKLRVDREGFPERGKKRPDHSPTECSQRAQRPESGIVASKSAGNCCAIFLFLAAFVCDGWEDWVGLLGRTGGVCSIGVDRAEIVDGIVRYTMNSRIWLGLCTMLAVGAVGYSKPKNKDDFPKALLNARYAYVEAEDGDIQSFKLIPEDRRAITDVTDALRDWKRYDVTFRRSEAEILFVVRKERIASAKVGGTIGRGTVPGTSPGTTETQTHEAGRLGAEIGPNEDMLYGAFWSSRTGDEVWAGVAPQFLKQTGWISRRIASLFQKFKGQVDAASKAQGAAKGGGSTPPNSKP